MLKRARILFPDGGLSENWALGDQPIRTSRDEQNMRTQDPITRRQRGAQRAGLTDLPGVVLGSGKVQELAQVTLHQRAIAYAVNGAITGDDVAWSSATSSTDGAFDLAVDKVGNVYALDGGQSIRKFSADGKKIIDIPIPLDDLDGRVRTLEVDEFGQVYAAVSELGDYTKARIWSWKPFLNEDGEIRYQLLWTIDPQAFIGQLKWFDSKLYSVQNNPNLQTSRVFIYRFVSTAAPQIETSWEVPYPSKHIQVGENGQVYVGTPPFVDRGVNPDSPDTPNVLVGKRPIDFHDDGDIRIWSHFDAELIDDSDLGGSEAVPKVLRWRDTGPKGKRHFYRTSDNGGQAPNYVKNGPLASKPAIFFDGTVMDLASLVNPSVLHGNAEEQLSAVPGYQGGQYAIFMLVSPVAEASIGTILSQEVQNTLGETDAVAHTMFISANRTEGDSEPGAINAGRVSVRSEGASSDAWLGAGSNPRRQIFDVFTDSGAGGAAVVPQAMLLTFVCDGGLDLLSDRRSVFRVNGVPVDLASSRPIESLGPTYLGETPNIGGNQFFHGWIHEILVLEARDRDDDTSGIFADWDTANLAYQYPTLAYQAASDSIMEQVEGYMTRKWGCGHLLDDGATRYEVSEAGGADSTFIHPYSDASGALNTDEVPWDGNTQSDPNQFSSIRGMVTKYNANSGKAVWIAGTIGGYGSGMALFPVSEDGANGQDVYTIGADDPDVVGLLNFRRLIDAGDDFTLGYSGNITGSDPVDDFLRPVVDQFSAAYNPLFPGTATATYVRHAASGTRDTAAYVVGSAGIGNPRAYCVVLPPDQPDTGLLAIVNRPEFVYVGTESVSSDGGTPGLDTVYKSTLLSNTPTTDPPRQTIYVGTAGGDVVTYTSAGIATPTGGSGFLNSASRFVSMTTLFGKIYGTDGQTYFVFDPVADTVETMLSEDGTLPLRMRVFENWRGRLVGFGNPDDPHNWYMSKKDNPLSWNTSPPVQTPSQAVDGNNPDLAGRTPEVINGFIPVTDDLAFITTDSSIFRMHGDPLSGGQIDLVTKKFGGSFGRSWTQDPEGNIYLFLNYGGVMRLSPDGQMLRLSEARIEKRLQDINLADYFILMEWDWYADGLLVLACPYAATGSSIVEHYFWERRSDSWRPDRYGLQGLQPTAVAVLDGDAAADRRVVIGSEDGRLRMIDPTVNDDDGTAIDAYTTIGPIAPEGEQSDFAFRFTQFEIVLANDQGGAQLELLAGDDAEDLVHVSFHDLVPGRNPRIYARVKAPYCYLRLRNSLVGQRFAIESIALKYARAGRKRPTEIV